MLFCGPAPDLRPPPAVWASLPTCAYVSTGVRDVLVLLDCLYGVRKYEGTFEERTERASLVRTPRAPVCAPPPPPPKRQWHGYYVKRKLSNVC